ncbi:MAG: tyrosine-type recombinase/integrase [Anaerolineales bacterium]
MNERTMTLAQGFESFEAQSNLSARSLDTYRYALRHFYDYLEGSRMAARTSLGGQTPAEAPLNQLGGRRQDVNLIMWFVNYLGQEVENAKPRRGKSAELALEPATVRLYGQAIITFFRFLADELLLPEAFPATSAMQKARRLLRTYVPASEARDGAPEPPEGIEELIRAFDHPVIDEEADPEEVQRQQREALRNRALLYALADSGARVSEILRLEANDVRAARLNPQGIWQVRVRGKGRGKSGRLVTLRFSRGTLRAMKDYLSSRNDPGATALFVSHAKTRPKYRGEPMSANAVWRMIRRTVKSLGLPHIHPHDFRHWRATQMLQEGVPIDQVQRFLNHKSIRTTQLYAKTAEQQVDEAGLRTSPIADED